MKNIIIVLLMLFSFIQSGKCQISTDSIIDIIEHLDLESYEGKPVDSLLSALPIEFRSMKLYGHLTNDRVDFLGLQYATGISVWIFVQKFEFMNPVDPDRIWNLSLYRREKLGHAIFLNSY